MQTTLLGIAIALILALATALVGPLLVDWSRYRAEFEAHASRLTGLEFHITGPIDARVLPTPMLVMRGIDIARPGDLGNTRARALRIEFGLGALMRGEWRITDAYLEAPEFAAGINAEGRVDWSAPKVRFHPEGVSIERLYVKDGRAVFRDAASGSQLALEQIELRGEMRSLSGPFKGEGSFVSAGKRLPYRISTGRIDEAGGIKIRLSVDAIDRMPTAEAEISISFDHGAPHFEGQLQFARPVGRAPSGSQFPVIEPWRLASRIKGDAASAMFEQIEWQYGPDERAIKLKGSAQLKLGSEPRADVVLSSTQIDLDHIAGFWEAERRSPMAAAKALAEAISDTLPLPVPANISVAIDSLSLGGAVLQRVSAELERKGQRLEIKALDFRAPGLSQVGLSGSLERVSSEIHFAGPARIEANDPRAFLAWLTGRSDTHAFADGALRLRGNVSLSGEAIAVEGLDFQLERMHAEGRFSYGWGGKDRAARLDAAIATPDMDFDRVYALVSPMLGDTVLPWPREGTLSLKIGRASLLGIEAKQTDVSLRLDAQGLAIDPVIIADFGGANLSIRGRIDATAQSPRGAITLDLEAGALGGILAIVEKFAPDAAEQIRRLGSRVTPLLLRASIALDAGSATNRLANVKLKADGRAGTFRIGVLGDGTGASDAFKIGALKLSALAATKINFAGRLESDDGAALLELLHLDRFISADKGPGRLAVTARGTPDGDLDVDGRMSAGPLAIATNGRLRFALQASSRGELDLKLSNANVRSPRPALAGRVPELVPVSAAMHLAFAGDTVHLTDLTGSIAGGAISGRLDVGVQRPMTVEGELDVAAIDLPGVLATAMGIPVRAAGAGAGAGASISWPTEPFEQMISPLSGAIAFNAKRVRFTPKLEARDLKGVLHLGESQIALQAKEGALSGGQLSGELILLREPEGLLARTRVKVVGANAADLLPGDGAISGLLRFEMNAEGSGMSAMALVGSLEGSGTFTLDNARLARLDPKAFEVVVRAVDQGIPIDTDRLRERTDAALAKGALSLPRAEGTIAIAAGQARLSNSMEGERGVELSLRASMGVPDSDIDARLVLTGASALGASRNAQPEIMVALKGPINAPKRSVDVTAFASWLALRAVEQQSKKLDVLEGGGEIMAPETGSAEQRSPEKPVTQGTRDESPPIIAPSGADATRPRPSARQVRKPKPPGGESLYPPVDARPPYFWFGVH